jgi:Ni/Fe-hydrogenase subunit HybB-like protein
MARDMRTQTALENMAEVDGRPPVIAPGFSIASVTDKISSIVLAPRTPLGWYLAVATGLSLTGVLGIAITYLLYRGVGIWGINIPVGWGFAIINFVWWIGIGHAGTLISAILLLLKQSWRNSINRFAEAMTLFAVMCAGMFPLLHMGRPWLGYWMFPYPNTMTVWPQFRSPLVWDVFAVSTYFTISLLFWYLGLLPDLATLRDQAKSKPAKMIYGFLSFGWRGSARHWSRYESAYLLLAGLATPLVLSVHTVVSFDFAIAILPGWHTTIFPPYFVDGAIYSGFAMVLILAIPIRKFYGLEDIITMRHLDNMGKIMLATGIILTYGYMSEIFFSWYGGSTYDKYVTWNRMHGPYAFVYWLCIFCNCILPQLLWISKIRLKPILLFLISVDVLLGMWFERFMIIVISLNRDFLTSSWGTYIPTRWDWAVFTGTLGFFLLAMVIFIRVLPMITIFEMRELVHKTQAEEVVAK